MDKDLIERFFKKESRSRESSGSNQSNKFIRVDLNEFDPLSDPGDRPQLSEYHPSDREVIRRKYLAKGPYQPRDYEFREKEYPDRNQAFKTKWFDKYATWLEYSPKKEAAFCLYCFLFGVEGIGKQETAFTKAGFDSWHKATEGFRKHIGDSPNSHHQQNEKSAMALMKQSQSIASVLDKQSDKMQKEYQIRLEASLDCIRYLLFYGLAFRAHDESDTSSNWGNYLGLLQFLVDHNEDVKSVALDNAPKNCQLTCPAFQKEITKATANETTKAIVEELNNDLFSILVDESRDISCKEQMALVVRFVHQDGIVVERFLGIIHVLDTSALNLKEAVLAKLADHNMCLSRIRGQGYDGASNMRGEFNGLKSLILNENRQAYYIHCFAHQLQLTLVAVAKNHDEVTSLFEWISTVQNTVAASAKRRDKLRAEQALEIDRLLGIGEIETGKGRNQELGLKRAGDTRWSSHYSSITNMIILWPSVIKVLEGIMEEASDRKHRHDAKVSLDYILTFEFVFLLHMMQDILGKSHVLSQALQRKDQDIVNALDQVIVVKRHLQSMRDDSWEPLLQKVSSFCETHEISIPDMAQPLVARGRPRRNSEPLTNEYRYRVQLLYTVLDMLLKEFDERFGEMSSNLLRCMACLDPRDSFKAFNKGKLIEMASFYPNEFKPEDIVTLGYQLDTYILTVQMDDNFKNLRDVSQLSKKLVETKNDRLFPEIYMLIKLALLLPVATTTVERAFSAMNLVKTKLRNRMCDSWMNDCLVTYIEKDVFQKIPNKIIMQHYQQMKSGRSLLPDY